jgi:hypothetical protein
MTSPRVFVSYSHDDQQHKYALAVRAPNYESLWQELGPTYTVHGALMVIGGLLFAGAALKGESLPSAPVLLFGGGLLVNLTLALVPAPDILQTLAAAIRNAGLVGMGYAILVGGRDGERRTVY